jgi:UPF0271 protein
MSDLEAPAQMDKKMIDLNSDVGESFGAYTLGLDDEVIPLVTSANIACGYHAGDPAVMRRTVSLAAANSVGIGAHPGLPDLMGFGRRAMAAGLEEIKGYLAYQIGALQAFAAMAGKQLQHVKPHGALYNMAERDPAIWEATAEVMAAVDRDLILFLPAATDRGVLDLIGRTHGVRPAREFFADRAYERDGRLVPRKLPGAVIRDHQRAAEQVLRMVTEGVVVCRDESRIPLTAETVCVHGDNPEALNLVRHIRQRLTEAGVAIRPVGEFL